MNAGHLAKINHWFLEELAELKTKSANDQDGEDPTVADLALSKTFEEHFSEIEIENDFIEEAFVLVFHKTPPWDLRDIADEARERCLITSMKGDSCNAPITPPTKHSIAKTRVVTQ